MKTRIIGDIHGMWYEYHALASEAERSIQVGDFGIGFAGPYWHERVDEFHLSGDHRFIRGNHDHPAMCHKMAGWIPDGTVENDVMLIGGAWSIDWAYRTEGVSWWADEECSIPEFERMIDVYAATKPRVMITHDAPLEVSDQMFIKGELALGGPNAKSIKTRTGQALQTMFDIHQPEEWYFGHWHHTKTEVIRGTKFTCLGEMDYVDVDL